MPYCACCRCHKSGSLRPAHGPRSIDSPPAGGCSSPCAAKFVDPACCCHCGRCGGALFGPACASFSGTLSACRRATLGVRHGRPPHPPRRKIPLPLPRHQLLSVCASHACMLPCVLCSVGRVVCEPGAPPWRTASWTPASPFGTRGGAFPSRRKTDCPGA